MSKEDIFDTIQELEVLIESIKFDYKQSDEDKKTIKSASQEIQELILDMYKNEDKFTKDENYIINTFIENKTICTEDIHETIMGYIYERMENEYPNLTDEDIWEFTDENVSNGMTAKENYNRLIEFMGVVSYKSCFQLAEDYQKFLRKEGRPFDVVKIGDSVFIQDYYDMGGQTITYKSDNNMTLEITNSNRYKKGFGDSEVEIY